MFERFTGGARRVVVRAQEEARALKHNYIGTEHILLGVLADQEDVSSRALANAGISPDQVRQEVLRSVPEGESEPTGHVPFTPRAKKVLELSLREALQLRHNYIGTEHILLGILREGRGVAARALHARGADAARLRREVVRLTGTRDDAGEAAESSVGLATRPLHTPAAAEVLAAAEELASGSPIGSHHLLEALAHSHRSAAGHALAAAGVDVEVLAAALDDIDLAGTTDLTPAEEAARQTEIRVEGDAVHVVLRDPALVDRVRSVVEQLGGPVRGTDPVAGGLVTIHQAVVRYLERLARRLDPGDDPADQPQPGISAVVRQAVRSRLRRRRS
jgi:ATP-dependent Clp protease ATP-binding subunit ClpA